MHPRLLISPRLRRDFRFATARRSMEASANSVEWSRRQLDALRGIWSDAIADIPYYAALANSGTVPHEIRTWSDFRQIPVLTRQILQNQPEQFIRHSGPPDSYTTTAGSTGTPLCIGMDQASRDLMRIVKLSAWMGFGYVPASRLFLIWGHSHLLGTGWQGKVNHVKRKLADGFLGYQRVDAYRLDRASCVAYAEQLLRFRPLGLIGYASALDLFARYTQRFSEKFRALGLKFVLATAEPPPNENTFRLLEDLFGCPVVQEYGGAEFGQVAFKIGSAPFKVYSDIAYLECESSEEGDAQSCPALVTTLYPRYLPLFRYRNGDALIGPERLPHGHVTKFQQVAGRVNDEICLADGSSIHSVAIFHCIHQEPSVLNIQMVLKDEGIDLRLISTLPNDSGVETRIRRRLAQVHPDLGRVNITYVEDLQTNRAGKRRWFVDERVTVSPEASG